MGELVRFKMYRFVLLCLAIMGASTLALAKPYVYLDFDGTIVESRKTYGGSFPTPIVLFKISQHHPIQKDGGGPARVYVSAHDYKNIKDRLAQIINGKAIPGSLKKYTLESGQTITIGDYYIDEHRSFEHYYESFDGTKNHLLEDFKEIEKRDSNQNWKGPSWELMVEALSDLESSKKFGIITNRGHSDKDWLEFFEYLKSKGYIRYLPVLSQIHGVSRPKYFSFGETTSERKVKILEILAIKNIGRLSMENADYVVSTDGKNKEKAHVLVYADDSQKVLDGVFEKYKKIMTGRYSQKPLKLVLINTGYDKDVKQSGRPRVYIIHSDGTARSASKKEILEDLNILNFLNFERDPLKFQNHQCKRLFS